MTDDTHPKAGPPLDALHLPADQMRAGASQVRESSVTQPHGSGRPLCPLIRAALATGDTAVIDAVGRVHPRWHCPAARRERAA